MVGFVMDYTFGGRSFPEIHIDPKYEFSAPHYFDFIQGETIEEANEAESWFKTACTYAASPFGPKIKARKSFAASALCSFKEATSVEQVDAPPSPGFIKESEQIVPSSANGSSQIQMGTINCDGPDDNATSLIHQDMEACTPRTQIIPKVTEQNAGKGTNVSNKASVIKPGVSKSDKQCVPGSTVTSSTKQAIARRIRNIALKKEKSVEKSAVNEHQAVKRQKLEAGRLRQILNIKERILPHKVQQSNMAVPKDLTAAMDKNKERQWKSASKIAMLASPFVSMAEKVKRFQSRTPERFRNQPISQDGSVAFLSQKPKLMLTRPKEPELETAQRARPIRVKSTAELEEEMLAKIPKFRARPLNKKILEAPSLPPLQKSAPQLPEFQEFHLKTMERAMQHCATSSIASSSADSAGVPDKQRCEPAPGGVLTEPKAPHLETALRARPPKVKSSAELELEELEKMPKFKARPLNKKIFVSRGDLGVFCHLKRQVTTPTEFHFATDERPHPPPLPPTELFKKLSLNSEPHHDPVPQPTKPHPFHLLTEDRGAEKERKFMSQLLEDEQKEQQARIPRANPYPYTTDYPVIPPKPQPKECTRPEPFQLESLIRHEEELQRMMEEQARIEREVAEMRNFRAQPMLSNVPVHVPERPRKPLTEVQEFTFHADVRAVERAEFDKKVKEKENLYKRFREDYETARMIEEERAVKMMRKMMVPHARPLPAFNNPFVPQRSTKELTKPKSPKLRVLNRKERRRSSILSMQKKFQMR